MEKLLEAKRGQQAATTELDLEGLFTLLLGKPMRITQRKFIYDPAMYKAYMGVVGCAKTSTICAAGLARALLQPGSRGMVGRYDYNDLMDTTALRLQEMLQRLPKGVLLDRDKSPPMKWWIQPAVSEGEPSQITFMGLKEALGSYDFNWAIVDEADELEERRLLEIDGRLRSPGGDYMLAMSFNPPDTSHPLYTLCTGYNHEGRKIREPMFKLFQPVPDENVENLPLGYYERLARNMPEDMRRRLVEGHWGATFPGAPVMKEFRHGVHVKDELVWTNEAPLLRFWDFGFARPFCIWAQIDFEGRLLHLHEKMGDQTEALDFIRHCKSLTQQQFPGARDVLDYGDPAVVQKKDTGSTLSLFHQEGINMMYLTGQSIDSGINLLRRRLGQLISGEPAMQFDRRRVPILIRAFQGGYHLDKMGQKPVKDGFYDHPMDAERYGCTNVFGAMGNLRAPNLEDIPDSVAMTE